MNRVRAFATNSSVRLRAFLMITLATVATVLGSYAVSSTYLAQRFTTAELEYLKREVDNAQTLLALNVQKSIEQYLRGIGQTAATQVRAEGFEYDPEDFADIPIGPSGYIYIINSSGTILFHPYPDLVGVDVSEHAFVQAQMRDKVGLLEYEWQNPDEDSPRPKILWMEYYAPRDWIISVSAYREEVVELLGYDRLLEITGAIENWSSGVDFVFDSEGRLLYPPDSAPDNEARSVAELMVGSGTPQMGPLALDSRRDVYLTSTLVSGLGWTLVTLTPRDNVFEGFSQYATISGISTVVVAVVIAIICWLASLLVFRPVYDLTEQIRHDARSLGVAVAVPNTRNELKVLRDIYQGYQERLTDLVGENSILSKFAAESPNPVFRVDSDGIAYSNEAGSVFLDAGQEVSDILNAVRAMGAGERSPQRLTFTYEERVRHFEPILIPAEHSSGSFVHLFETTDRLHHATTRELLSTIFAESIESLVITDENGTIESVNRSFLETTGYTRDEVLGQNPRVIKSDYHDASFYKEMWTTIGRGEVWSREIWNRKKSGTVYPSRLTIAPFHDASSASIKYLALSHDMSSIHSQDQTIESPSFRDVLTGLPNRALLTERLSYALKGAQREQASVTVILLDVAMFAEFNETFGYLAGDNYLKALAQSLRSAIRDSDTVARFAADQFCFILDGDSVDDDGQEIAERILKAARGLTGSHPTDQLPRVKLGVAIAPRDGSTLDTVIHAAEAALGEAKRQTERDFAYYNRELELRVQRRLVMEFAIDRAIDHEELKLVYQPKVNSLSGKVVGFEALMRWSTADGRAVSPAEFIPVAEATGQIRRIGTLGLSYAASFLARLRAAGALVPVSLNVSAQELADVTLTDRLLACLSRHELDPGDLELELTETAAITNLRSGANLIDELRKMGFRVSIDDFGTGYSSLQYLNELEFDVLKIDRSFTRGLPDDRRSVSIARAIVALGQGLEKEIVAEGVEHPEQVRFLESCGCSVYQGYFFSKPLSEAEAFELATDTSMKSLRAREWIDRRSITNESRNS